MDNYNFSVDDFISSIENNNQNEIVLNTNAMKYHINTILKDLLLNHTCASISKIAHSCNPKSVIFNTNKVNIDIIKEEIKIALYLINNIDYLYGTIDKEKAIYLIYVYYYFVLIDLDRVEFVELNSNKGRTILSSYRIEEINDYLEKVIENMNNFSTQNNNVRELKNEE